MVPREALLQEQIPRLRRYARALLRDPVRADDLVQDTLERACSRFGLWRPGSDLRAWLFTIMHNVFVNQVRRKQVIEMSDSLDDSGYEPSVTDNSDHAMAVRDLGNALQQLSDEYREVLLLVGLEQMQYAEAAKVLDVPVGTVMSRLSRGREQLRVLLQINKPVALRRVK